MRRALLPFAALAAAIALIAAGGGGAAASERTVGVTLGDRSLTAGAVTVPAGRVAFESRNDGTSEHELLIVRTELAPDELGDPRFAGVYALGSPHDHFASVSGVRSRHVAPGRSRRDVVDLAPGRYVLFCGLPGHYESGQRTGLTVTGR